MNSLNNSKSLIDEDISGRNDSFVLFETSGFSMALPFNNVREVINYIQPVKVSGTPPCLMGIVNYFGQVCPVISMNSLTGVLDLKNTAQTCIIMLESPQNSSIIIGILADRFSGSIQIHPGEIKSFNILIEGLSNDCIAGAVRINDLQVLVFKPFVFLEKLEFITLK